MMKHVEQARSILAALNKRLTTDLFRFQRRTGSIASTDLCSNYDRIVHSIAGISMQRQGIQARSTNDGECWYTRRVPVVL
jgi:hypothetical protein